jgi:RNAse (barnase) inhibitor barstar
MKDAKDIKDMSLLEISDALDTATYVYQNELSDLAKRLRAIHEEHAKTIDGLWDILEDRRRTAEEEHCRNMNEANL